MLDIKFPDGSVKQFKNGITPFEIAKSISNSLAKSILSASFNEKTIELSTKLNENGNIKFYSWDNDEGKKAFWHSTAHVLAQVILEFYPKSKLTIGPAIDSGFYYDVDFGGDVFSENDFLKIEKRIIEISREGYDFKMRECSKDEAIEYYKSEKNEYKLELIDGIDDKLTFCDHSNFSDLCRGGHLLNTKLIKSVKLLNVAGAYWRGNENNKQLTRIYGISFPKEKLLNEYLQLIEEAKKRDHRVIGKKMNLFTFSSKVGQGLPLWLPAGAELRERLENFLKKAQKNAGYEMVISPHIGNKKLYEISGHYEKYGESSFHPIKTPNIDEEFLLKPMNCPHHCEIYNSQQWSYRDLPKRFAEFGTVYRYEQSGELHGLTRVRGFTQDDAHIFCTEDQLIQEFKNVIDLVLHVFRSLGFEEFTAQISLRDKENKEKYIGSDEIWKIAEDAIIEATEEKELNYRIEYGEAAFYGPKLDFMVKDALNREWQLGTIQVDYNLPERFNLSYKNQNNELVRPVMIHRAPFGSLERFIAILIEHTGGIFPLWLATNQIKLIAVGDKHKNYTQKVSNLLEKSEIRATSDLRNETVGKKIREAEKSKIPFMGIIGDKEVNNQTISIRAKGGEEFGEMDIEKLINFIREEELKSYN
ncbi:MAG: threonine--tRNA ligase [Flavobacteriaceae bacterium]|nr:threonine--tRNA ligase [Flavobacteriaceae bacterium]MBL6684177.1 threonine--tRNA ligase [Flavobacteriaceae bacterium]